MMPPVSMPQGGQMGGTTLVDPIYRTQVVDRLNHLFRHAGDSFETRLVYQAILALRLNEGGGP